jgi:hypothetical protein
MKDDWTGTGPLIQVKILPGHLHRIGSLEANAGRSLTVSTWDSTKASKRVLPEDGLKASMEENEGMSERKGRDESFLGLDNYQINEAIK